MDYNFKYIKFTSLNSLLEYSLYINMSTGYYEIESINCLKESGHTLFQPTISSPSGIITEFIN